MLTTVVQTKYPRSRPTERGGVKIYFGRAQTQEGRTREPPRHCLTCSFTQTRLSKINFKPDTVLSRSRLCASG